MVLTDEMETTKLMTQTTVKMKQTETRVFTEQMEMTEKVSQVHYDSVISIAQYLDCFDVKESLARCPESLICGAVATTMTLRAS